MKSWMKDVILPGLLLISSVVLLSWLIVSTVSSCTTDLEKRGLKNILEEVWEGKEGKIG